MMVLPDIEMRITRDFGNERKAEIIRSVEEFEEKFTGVYKEKPSPRIIRCILQLAEADTDKLSYYLKQALSDWRDVIYWAEYDSEDNRIFSGSRKFKSERSV
jgi:hypothetical protein